jgi:DNA polymerase-1
MSYRKIGQNLKYDLKILSNYSTVKGKLFDTMIALFDQSRYAHNMDIPSETYLKYSPQY